jgi:ABC-type multidrug transport system fused ATPase/permease subunit
MPCTVAAMRWVRKTQPDPNRILILDEATSSLDSVAERQTDRERERGW